MNVVVINGSPKGEESNTMALTREFLKGSKWTDAEIIDISKLNMRGCIGCFGCWSKTPGQCVIKDDMEDVLPKLIKADVVIWSFPLYYYSVPGDLKNFIDRQLPLALPEMDKEAESGGHPSRYDFSKQRHVLISTCGFWTHKGNYDSVTAMFNHICKYEAIFCGQGALFNIPDTPEVNAMEGMFELREWLKAHFEVVRRAGLEFTQGSIKEETHKLLAEPILTKEDYESSADASW